MFVKDELDIFCKNVAYLRRKNNLPKKQMAALLGISVKTLNKIENGNFPPRLRISVLEQILFTFRIPLRKIICPLYEDNEDHGISPQRF